MTMKKALCWLTGAVGLWMAAYAVQAQETGPLVIIQGRPDATTAPPEVHAYVSVIDWSQGMAIEELSAADFSVEEAEVSVESPVVSYEAAGLAVVVVVDRGGISAPGDLRIREATGLVRELVDRLAVTGEPTDDMIALVGIGQEGVLEPEVNFTYDPVDVNRVLNGLVTMEGEAVRGGTPVYEGVDEAIRLLTANTDAAIRDALSHRRKFIVVFSDGIDPNYSDTAREDDIIRKANAADISLYTVGMAQQGGRLSAEGNLVKLAHQSYGLYRLHNNDETHAEVLALLDAIMTQRNQYVVSYVTRQPRGTYVLDIRVDTPIGSADDSADFSSVLELPRIALVSPADGLQVTVPYSRSLEGSVPTTLTLSVQVTPVDGVERDPAQVRYFANDALVGVSTAPPDYELEWNVSTLVTPTEETQACQYTLVAEAEDAYLGERMESGPVTLEVSWGAMERTCLERAQMWLLDFWWLVLILAVLIIAMIVLIVLNHRMQGRLATKVRATTGRLVKPVTRKLTPQTLRAPGKLVIMQGAHVGTEFRLARDAVKVGRDPEYCDFALHDEYVSNPHFSVHLEQAQFFITDEGSSNGTRVNGIPLSPRQQVALQPDAVIEVGVTRLQFKRLGGTTRQLEQEAPSEPSALPSSAEPSQPSSSAPVRTPTQPASAEPAQEEPSGEASP